MRLPIVIAFDGQASLKELKAPTMNTQYLRALPRVSPSTSVALHPHIRTEITRLYATQSDLGSGPRKPTRKNITVLSDDGRYGGGELSGREKVSRATQQSFNFIIVLAGVVLTVWLSAAGLANMLRFSIKRF